MFVQIDHSCSSSLLKRCASWCNAEIAFPEKALLARHAGQLLLGDPEKFGQVFRTMALH